jgi:formylmethanofuran dehydrogenase subunit E
MSPQRLISIMTMFAVCCFCLPCHGLAADGSPGQDVYQRAQQFHGHTCTGLLIGIRIGIAAKEALQDAGVTGKLKARYYSRSCPVDGLQVAIGTTCGSKSLKVVDRREHRLVLSGVAGGRTIEAKLTRFADKQRLLSIALKKKMERLPDGAEEKNNLERELADVNFWFRTAPDAKVVALRMSK